MVITAFSQTPQNRMQFIKIDNHGPKSTLLGFFDAKFLASYSMFCIFEHADEQTNAFSSRYFELANH